MAPLKHLVRERSINTTPLPLNPVFRFGPWVVSWNRTGYGPTWRNFPLARHIRAVSCKNNIYTVDTSWQLKQEDKWSNRYIEMTNKIEMRHE